MDDHPNAYGCNVDLVVELGDMRLPAADQVRQYFRTHGVIVVREFLDRATVDRLADLAMAAANRCALHIQRSSGEDLLDYHVVSGDLLVHEVPPINAIYESDELLDWIRRVTATSDVGRSAHLRSAVNINILEAAGQQYRWHNDAVPFTAVLFLTTLPGSAGGELLVRTGPHEVLNVQALSGQFLLMDGQRCAHAVAPLRENALRITVPMVFPAVQVERPSGLDDYLYSSR